MVAHTLHEVAHQFGVEVRHWQLEQFDEEVAHKGNVDPHRDMQQKPTADEVDGGAANREHQLPQEYQPYKANILVLNTHIHDRLREERQNKLQQTAHEQA